MKVFQNTETLPVLLTSYLQRRDQKCYRVSTAFGLTSPEGPKLRYLLEDENNKGLLQKTHSYSRAQRRNFWWFNNCGSQSSHWRMWISTQSSTRCSGTGFGNSVGSILSVQDQNFSGIRKELAKVLGGDEETKSHSHWQFVGIWHSLWRINLESLCVNTAQIETGGIAERAVRSIKEGTSAVLLQSGLDEKWWADSMECYTYLRNVGRPHTRDALGNHLKDRSFRLVHWLGITLFLRKTSQESINWERKSYLDCSLDTLCTRVEFGRVTYWLQTLRSWKRWTHQKSTLKDSMQRK